MLAQQGCIGNKTSAGGSAFPVAPVPHLPCVGQSQTVRERRHVGTGVGVDERREVLGGRCGLAGKCAGLFREWAWELDIRLNPKPGQEAEGPQFGPRSLLISVPSEECTGGAGASPQ